MVLGVVVVGVGIAGRVRIRDIGQANQSDQPLETTLVGYVSRRKIEIDGVEQIENLETALGRKDVNIIIICTENARHEEIAKKAIEAGKHVLVEFPLALSHGKATQLLSLAKEKDVVCYEEDIALLTESHMKLKQIVAESTPLASGENKLMGKFNGWIEDLKNNGSPFHSSISQIHRMLSIFGEIVPSEASIKRSEDMVLAEATLLTKDKKPLKIIVDRGNDPDRRRNPTFCYKFEDGSVLTEVPPSQESADQPKKPGLFQQDFLQFLQCVKDKATKCTNEYYTLKGLEIADALDELARKNPNSSL